MILKGPPCHCIDMDAPPLYEALRVAEAAVIREFTHLASVVQVVDWTDNACGLSSLVSIALRRGGALGIELSVGQGRE